MSGRTPVAIGQGERGDDVYAVVSRVTQAAGVKALQIGFALMLIAAVSDGVFGVMAGGGGRVALEGIALVGLAGAGYARAEQAANLLTPPGRVVVCSALFGVAGIADWGVQQHFAEVAPAVVWIAVIVSSTRWVVLTVIVSALGYLAGLAIQGHTLMWMADGPGHDLVANQLVDLIANAGVVGLLVAIFTRFVRTIPEQLAQARNGAGVFTPQLNAAVGFGPIGLLGRGDPVMIVDALTDQERDVLRLLADGLAPKQAALELRVSVSAVRTRIANAKRRTGSRTLEQLIALFAEVSGAD